MTFTYMQAHIWQSIETESWNGPNTPVHHRCEGRYSRLYHPLGQRIVTHGDEQSERAPRVITVLLIPAWMPQMMFSSKAAIMSDCLFISIWFCWKEMGISFQPLTVHNYVKYWPSKFALITWASLLLLSCSLFRCLSRSNRACSAGLGIAATGLVVGGVTVWGGAGAGLGCLGATGAAGAVFSTGAGLLNNYLDPWQWHEWHV